MQLPWRSIHHPPVRRPVPSSQLPSAVTCLLAAQVTVFILQWGVREAVGTGDPLLSAGGLSGGGLRHGSLWEPLTALFVVTRGAEWLLPFNWLLLALAGRPLEAVVGRRHLVQLYLVAGSLGGLAQTAATWAAHGPDAPMGEAMAANGGVFFALACVMPRAALLPGVVAARPVKIVHGAAGAAAALTLLSVTGAQVSTLGSLVGGLAGCMSMWALGFGRRAQEEHPQAGGTGAQASPETLAAPMAAASGNLVVPRFTERERRMTPREFVSEQIDPILEKISRHGIGSLTAEERRVLDKGREKISQGR